MTAIAGKRTCFVGVQVRRFSTRTWLICLFTKGYCVIQIKALISTIYRYVAQYMGNRYDNTTNHRR